MVVHKVIRVEEVEVREVRSIVIDYYLKWISIIEC